MEFDNNWNVFQKALYYDHKGDWHKAHNLVDGKIGKEAAHIHAYLHRKEGDNWNARYWYTKANQIVFIGSLNDEWESLWTLFSK